MQKDMTFPLLSSCPFLLRVCFSSLLFLPSMSQGEEYVCNSTYAESRKRLMFRPRPRQRPFCCSAMKRG